jgi:hypothetical protein
MIWGMGECVSGWMEGWENEKFSEKQEEVSNKGGEVE